MQFKVRCYKVSGNIRSVILITLFMAVTICSSSGMFLPGVTAEKVKNSESPLSSSNGKTEGPHIMIIDEKRVEILYLNYPSGSGSASVTRDTLTAEELPAVVDGILIEPEDIILDYRTASLNSCFTDVNKIFVVGDIHGEYERVIDLLSGNGIIDNGGNWSWGDGHLVFIGDIFDRGKKVTETLWLIFNLEKQARKAGGKVHLILGNHENMIFRNDLRYVADEYSELCNDLDISYPDLFNERSILGHWLRQKPVMIQINRFTFVHAGISPKMLQLELPVDTINSIIHRYMNGREIASDVNSREFILGREGALWFRGMVNDGSREDLIDQATLSRALEFFRTEAFIIGHTEVDSITSFFNKKVIDVNIPKRHKRIREQGLLIEQDRIIVVDNKGRQRAL